MMVPTGKHLPPQKVNSILNTFFGILASEPPEVADTFIKDRTPWGMFTRLALKAARINPGLLIWILDFITLNEIGRWIISFLNYTVLALISQLLAWVPGFARWVQPWLEPRFPNLWFGLLATSYSLTDGLGKPQVKAFQTTPNSAVMNPQSKST
jgi:lycopene cyclase CruA